MNPPRCRLSSQQTALNEIHPLGVCFRFPGRYCSNVSEIRLMPNYSKLFDNNQEVTVILSTVPYGLDVGVLKGLMFGYNQLIRK